MECSLAIKGIASTKILQELQGAFLKFTGMEFSFVDLKGKPVIIPQYAGHSCKAFLSSKKKDSTFPDTVTKSCNSLVSSKKPVISEYNKTPLAFVPILIEGNAIGAVLMCPGDSQAAASKEQFKGAAELLFIFVNYVFKHEFEPEKVMLI